MFTVEGQRERCHGTGSWTAQEGPVGGNLWIPHVTRHGPDGAQADYASDLADCAVMLLVRRGFPGRPGGLEGALRKGRPWKDDVLVNERILSCPEVQQNGVLTATL